MIAFAAKAGFTASDGDGINSPFAVALTRHLATPGLDLRKAFGFIRDEVMKKTNNRQEPYVYGSLGGDDVALVPAKLAAPDASLNDDMRRDYELALQVATTAAWASFLNKYPSGFYADLAREQRDKAAASDPKARQREQDRKPAQQVTSLSPEAQPAKPTLSPAQTARAIQAELKRVGCFSGSAGDEWTRASRRSLELFNRHAGTSLEVRVASLNALEAIKSKPARVCPVSCDRGYKVDGESCVKISCGAGLFVNDDNECEKKREKPVSKLDDTPARREPPKREAPAAAKPQASGQIICTQSICRAVRPGCRVERSPKTWNTGWIEVCN
jgi:hypothetical protein